MHHAPAVFLPAHSPGNSKTLEFFLKDWKLDVNYEIGEEMTPRNWANMRHLNVSRLSEELIRVVTETGGPEDLSLMGTGGTEDLSLSSPSKKRRMHEGGVLLSTTDEATGQNMPRRNLIVFQNNNGNKAKTAKHVPEANEVMLRICVFSDCGTMGRLQSQYIFSGEQTLQDLCDELIVTSCREPSLLKLREDIQKLSNKSSLRTSMDSACFFIENRFYSTGPIDYSQQIKTWYNSLYANKTGYVQYNFATLDMNTKLGDIKMCLGKQYNFTHLGNCHHKIVFDDCFLLPDTNPPNAPIKYPVLQFSRMPPEVPKCSACVKKVADFYYELHPHLDSSRPYLCSECDLLFNYQAPINGESKRNPVVGSDYLVFPLWYSYPSATLNAWKLLNE